MILNPNNEKAGHEFDIKDFEEVKWHKMAIETIKSFEIEKVQAFQKILLRIGETIELRCPFMVPRVNSYAY